MSDRFYAETPIRADTVQLSGSEAHHLLHVMRAKVGTQVTLFDGSGFEFTARLTRTTRQQVELEVLSRSPVDRELRRELVLAVALPKGDRQTWLVRPTSSTLKRLRRTVIEASKQCGRNRLMQVAEAEPLEDYLRRIPSDTLRWIAHPQPVGQPDEQDGSTRLRFPPEQSLHMAVGPEGGFADDELRLAVSSGWTPIRLGPRVLRVETAAVALASMVVSHDDIEAGG